ncbi:phosphate ABC transporter substrate-binding protein [Spiroplasma cantharicola]|uniref:Phosphate ABC transporter substrate-binding protein n=1 Tax=Spiroplasma cantharicola TaxID=362837 RepID=A0A0M4KF48_9MOLU|nr:phosphate ABC transporter substrate-binding protein [Spiroplasma cantharicola]ALD66732.1 phosphate ABC transporter substrate-binding protein [Spiroplasma cantharicola]
MTRKISIILLTFLSVILCLWIWSAAAPKKAIILGGSTSVNPFMQKLTKEYYNKSEKVDFVYNSTGSQAGVGGVEKDMYTAGFISKDINDKTLTKGNNFLQICENSNECDFNPEVIKEIEKGEKDNSYIALEFAIDAIGVIYNPPTYWNQKIELKENKEITLNDLMNFDFKKEDEADKELLKKAYSGNYSWEELATELVNSHQWENNKDAYNEIINLINGQSKTKLITFTREDGSGTRSAFSDLTKIKDMSSSNVVNSNGSMIENMSKSPSLGYVSNGFLGQLSQSGIVKLAGFNGYKLPIGIDNDNPLEWSDQDKEWKSWESSSSESVINGLITDEFIKTVYDFKRPFIAIFNSYNKKLDQLIELFNFVNSNDSNEVFKSEGLVKNMKYKSLGGTSND